MSQISQEAVTIDTLKLLQETVDYLNRLPVVPMTHSLCKKIEAHLASPRTVSAKRAALEAEQLATTRVAQRYGPAGNLMAEVIVTAESVTYSFPGIQGMKSLESLRTGETLKWQPLYQHRRTDDGLEASGWIDNRPNSGSPQ